MASVQKKTSETEHNFPKIDHYPEPIKHSDRQRENICDITRSVDMSYSLQHIVEAFNSPLNEEQAWAVCFQCARYFAQVSAGPELANTGGIKDLISTQCLTGIHIKTDGHLYVGNSDTFSSHLDPGLDISLLETDYLETIGVVAYKALDHGLTETEERSLSPALEEVIIKLTESNAKVHLADSDNDEGIGHENTNQISSVHELMEVCSRRLEVPHTAPDHYRAVCRALVAEARELRSFLEKISANEQLVNVDEKAECERLEELGKLDWARLWMQVLGGLRHGVKLKKIERPESRHSEYELTPYEMLMDDIKSRRFTLNKIPVRDPIPPDVKKGAHDMILEFIRSRPPLNPAQSRRLRSPPAASPGIRDQMLEAIRTEPRQHLKPVDQHSRYVETSRTRLFEDSLSPTPTKRLIKADAALFASHSDEETGASDGDYDDEVDFTTDDEVFASQKQKLTPQAMEPLTPLDSPPMPWQRRVAMDLALTNADSGKKTERRHSITVCESPAPFRAQTEESFDGDDECDTPTEDSGMASEETDALARTAQFIWPHAKLRDPMQCLSLTVEEVMHIRAVLTKAELECLITNSPLYDLVSKGKICFSCKKTKFSLFGQWATKCKFCKRAVCSNCIKKMGIPSDRFQNVPVYTLSPSPLSPGSEHSVFKFGGTGSAPVSPHSPANIITSTPKQERPNVALSPDSTLAELQGPQMTICKDCKVMVVNIIRASRCTLLRAKKASTRRDKMAAVTRQEIVKPRRDFHLNLKPVYKT